VERLEHASLPGVFIVASCMKCGRRRIRKRKNGLRKCPRCGVLPGVYRLDRSGYLEGTTTIVCEQISDESEVFERE
jgi:ribosomal protein L37AE/L43A